MTSLGSSDNVSLTSQMTKSSRNGHTDWCQAKFSNIKSDRHHPPSASSSTYRAGSNSFAKSEFASMLRATTSGSQYQTSYSCFFQLGAFSSISSSNKVLKHFYGASPVFRFTWARHETWENKIITFFYGIYSVIDMFVAVEWVQTTMLHQRKCPQFKKMVDVSLWHFLLTVKKIRELELDAVSEWCPVISSLSWMWRRGRPLQ